MNLPAAGAEKRDLVALSVILERLLRLRAAPISMQLFKSAAAMQAIPRLRRPRAVHTMDQVVAQAARLGWTVGVTAADLVGDQCRAVVGLSPQDAQWRSGAQMVGVWFATVEDAGNHQEAMQCMPFGGHEALVVSPLGSGRLESPDIILFYATPGAMIYFINGLQWTDYGAFEWSVVGESSCADSWGRALKTRRPSLAIPCYPERRYGGVLDDEMLMALTVEDAWKAVDGMQALGRNGFRYPVPQYGIQQDAREGMGVSYPAPMQKDPATAGSGQGS